MHSKIRRQVHSVFNLFRQLPMVTAIRVVFNTILKRRVLLPATLNGVKLQFRTSTSDLSVAFSSLLNGEYDSIDVKDPKFILDVGANIGTSSIWFAKRYPGAKIIAIEPEEDNFNLLCENIRPWSNVVPIRAALGNVSGDRELFDRGTGPWGYTITPSPQTLHELNQVVRCVTVSEILEKQGMKRIDILKIDIEGGEKEVFETCRDWIDQIDMIAIELHDRIVPGCTLAFEAATTKFETRFSSGEKRFAYRR